MFDLLRCSRCGMHRPDNEFHRRKDRAVTGTRRGRMSHCKECGKAKTRRWKKENPDKPRPRRDKQRALLVWLKDRPCVDCGVIYHPAAMDFDHVHGPRVFRIDAGSLSRPDILPELAKCELRCANCHRIRHAMERKSV